VFSISECEGGGEGMQCDHAVERQSPPPTPPTPRPGQGGQLLPPRDIQGFSRLTIRYSSPYHPVASKIVCQRKQEIVQKESADKACEERQAGIVKCRKEPCTGQGRQNVRRDSETGSADWEYERRADRACGMQCRQGVWKIVQTGRV
jgi:hypothetical protein